jgi:hypothetical protein
VLQGSIAELSAGGRQWIRIGTRDPARALDLVAVHPAVRAAEPHPDGVHATLHPDVEGETAAADILRRLVESGTPVHRFEPARASLEQRFLEITTRLETAA